MSEVLWPEAGQAAPDFSLPDATGALYDLAAFSGRWLVLYFYPRDLTSGCTTEAVEFSALLPRFVALDAAVVGISRDAPASHGKFINQNGLTVLLLSDVDVAVHKAYGVWRLKKSYGKEALGVVRSTFLIDPHGVVRHVWPKVARTAGHAEAVLQTLTGLVKG